MSKSAACPALPGHVPHHLPHTARHDRHLNMDTEQINAIGTLLADLSARTEQLRGYL
jgi:hypothetical protein